MEREKALNLLEKTMSHETGTEVELSLGNRAQSVVFVREVCAQYTGPRRKRPSIKGPADASDFLRTVMKDNSREHFMTLFLSGCHEVVSFATVTTGLANQTLVHPREVFQLAVLVGAVAIVVAHNHPSGNLEPSDEDRAVTKSLIDAGDVLGIKVLDHLILGQDSFVSLEERGCFRR